MPGSLGSVGLRVGQFTCSAASFTIMLSIDHFASVTAFRYLIAAMALQCTWSLILAATDVYALIAKRHLHSLVLVSLFVVGDGVTSTLTFAAACATAGITVLVDNDLKECHLNPCPRYESAAAMAFLSWIMGASSFLSTLWLLATR